MVKVTNDAGTSTLATYTYGAGNRRLVATDAAQTRTYYGWAGGVVLAEYTEYAASPSQWYWSKSYIYMGGSLLATISPNGASESVEYHHPDRLGTRLTTNNLNTSSYEQATLPYGTALDAESTGATNRRFTSYDRSPTTGLDYALNRTYDSAQGRFTQVDPIEMEAVDLGDPQSLNLYSYCGNDPINYTDPSGLFFKKLFRSIGRIVAKVLKWAAVVVAVALVVIAIGTGQPQLLLVSALLFGVAFGGEVVQRILSGVNVGLSAGSFGRIGIGGTASTFPGNSLQGGGEIVDYGDVINFPSKPAYDSYWAYLRAQAGRAIRGVGIGVSVAMSVLAQSRALGTLIGEDISRRIDEGSTIEYLNPLTGRIERMGLPIPGMGTTRMMRALPSNARTFTNSNAAFSHLQKYHGIDPRLASERLHRIKYDVGRGPADNVLFDRTGGVWDPVTRQYLGNLTEGGSQRIR